MCTCTKRLSSVILRISLVQCYTQIVQFTCNNTKRLDNAFVQSYVHVFVSHTISYLRQVLQAPHQHTSTALTPGDQHRKPSAEGVWSALLGTPFYHCTWGVTINIKEKTIMKCWSVKVLSKQPPFSCEYCQEFYLASIIILANLFGGYMHDACLFWWFASKTSESTSCVTCTSHDYHLIGCSNEASIVTTISSTAPPQSHPPRPDLCCLHSTPGSDNQRTT